MSTTKIGKSTTKILKLLFLTINLHFFKSNQTSTYRKLNLPLICRNAKKDSNRPKYTSRFFIFYLKKKTTHKPLKVAAAKHPFVQCVCYPFVQCVWYKLLRRMFSILCDNWKTVPFVKVYRYSETLKGHVAVFFALHKKWSSPLKISPVNVTKSAVSCRFGHIYWRNR